MLRSNEKTGGSMTRLYEKMPGRDALQPSYVSVHQFAQTVGVTPTRISQLIKRGRIEGVKRLNNRCLVPEDARILPAKNQMPGPVTDYVNIWHERHKDSYPEPA
jgi:hypothetical protein